MIGRSDGEDRVIDTVIYSWICLAVLAARSTTRPCDKRTDGRKDGPRLYSAAWQYS